MLNIGPPLNNRLTVTWCSDETADGVLIKLRIFFFFVGEDSPHQYQVLVYRVLVESRQCDHELYVNVDTRESLP